jgi:cell division protein FtsW (lipid II flippase)
MLESIKSALNSWKASKTERQKLQHAYLVIAIIVVLVAGLVSLLNPDRGQQMTWIALIAITAFLVNAITWNLLQSALLSKLNSRPRRK